MLSLLRSATSGILAKILLFVLVISFAIWGASGAFISGTGSSTVQFGNTKVGLSDLRLAYDLRINALSRQLGQRITRDQARNFGIEQSVMSQVIAGAVLDETARKMGMGISNDRLAKLIADDPNFKDSTGRFSRLALDNALRQIGMSQQDYLKNRKAVAVRRQFLDAMAEAANSPQAFFDAFGQYQAQKRVFDYIDVGKSAITDQQAPSESDIQSYYDAHKSDYVAPEYRKVVIVRLTAEDISQPDLISKDAIAADYNAHKSRYTTPERRRIQQLVFKDKAAAEAALKRIRGGELFDTIVTETGRTPNDIDLGLVAKKQLPDPKIADAAFGLKLNEVSDVVDGVFGPVLLRVVEVEPEEVKPLDAVAGDIRKHLALNKATEDLFDVHDKLEDARAAGDTLTEAAKAVGLTPRVIDQVDAQGKAPDGKKIADIPEERKLLSEVFQTDPDVETDPISIGTTGFVWYAVKAVTPKRQKPLEEVHDAVAAAWTEAEIAKKISALADKIRDRVSKGETLAAVAAELLPKGQDGAPAKPTTTPAVTRNDANAKLSRDALSAGFSIPKGDVTVVPGAKAPARIVLQVDDVIAGKPTPTPDNIKKEVDQSVSDEILNAMVSDLQSHGELKVNQRAVETALTF